MITIDNVKLLNDLEYDIYIYLISHQDEVMKAKLKDIADKLHVSSSMITRVCQKLGSAGFTEFKIQLRYVQQQVKNSDEGTIEYLIDYFESVNNHEYQQTIQNVANTMVKSNQIIFFGVGLSGAMAKYGAYLFNRKGLKSFYIDDFSHRFNVYDSTTTFIVLTVSGETAETNNQIILIKETGAKVIVITNSSNSTAAKIGDDCICYYVPSNQDQYFYSSATQVPVVYIFERLAMEIEKLGIR